MSYSMPQDLYLLFHEEFCNKARELSKLKQSDYVNLSSSDVVSVFDNFRVPEKLGIANCETVLLCRLSDKFARLINCINKEHCEVSDETVNDTLLDMLNFICLIAYYKKLKSHEH